MGIARDTIEVRPDERFDSTALGNYLKDKLEGADQPLTVRQFGGGAANLTYLLDYGSHQYVLRRPPLGPVAPSAHDMAREYKVLSVLHKAFPLAPQAFHFSDVPNVLNAPFFIMERREGVVVRKKIPSAYANIPDSPRRMSLALVKALADLHAVDYTALGLQDLGKPNGFIHRQIEGWHKRWQRAKVEDLAEMNSLYQWLLENEPPESAFTLVHNDYKLDNVMLSAEDPGQLVAIFDWDMCTLGDPLSDLGALLCYWTEPTDPAYYQGASMMPTGDLGFLSRAELVQHYAQYSGRDVSHIHFYHALGLFRLTVIVAQIYIRYKRGQTQDQRFAAFGPMIPLVARMGYEVAIKAGL